MITTSLGSEWPWGRLPAAVREAIAVECGPVARVVPSSAGRHSDFSATLWLAGDQAVFCKGVADADGGQGRMHRHEAAVNPWLPEVAPRLRWQIDTAGWLLLGFDHVPGRHDDLAPGSPDLPLVATTVTTLARDLAGCAAPAPRLAEQWARLAAWRRLANTAADELDPWVRQHLDQLIAWEHRGIEAADGNALLHTDLHALNILTNATTAHVVDWAWSRLGAPPVDTAFLIARLIAAGHTPPQAEQWADAIPAWHATPTSTRTALAVTIWGIWEHQQRRQPRPLWRQLTPAAQAWARHRLDTTEP